MKKQKALELLCIFLAAALVLGGCNRKTTISREDQLKDHPQTTTVDTTTETTDATEASEDTTGITQDTTVADQTDATEVANSSGPEETKAEETKPEETKPQESKPQDTKPQETKPQDTKPQETKPQETKPQETKPQDTKPQETKPQEAKPQETKPQETEPEETEPEQTEPEETKADSGNELWDLSGYSMGQLEYAIVDAMNAQRTAAGLSALSINHRLSAICSVRAYECTLNWSHTRPNGTECFTALKDYDYSGYSMAAENLLYCTAGFTAEEMVEGWMNSEGHRANIMNPNYHITGVDVYEYNGLLYVAAFYTD